MAAVLEFATPDISHLTEEDYDDVYEPAEDSFILLDALEQDVHVIREMKPSLCLEIGVGSGVVSVFLQDVLGPITSLSIGVDVNPAACAVASRTATQNNKHLDPVRSDLLTGLKGVYGKVDILLFNPPYVPTDEEELDQTQDLKGIGGAWAGGGDGMGLTNLLLPQIPEILAPGGRLYLVAVEQNKPLEIIEYMKSLGLDAETALKRRAGREHLSVIRITKR